MKFFSQRKGLKPLKNIVQRETMNSELRNGLWNVIYVFYRLGNLNSTAPDKFREVVRSIWMNYYKLPVDDLPIMNEINYFRELFFNPKWFEVYDLIEEIIQLSSEGRSMQDFINGVNIILDREISAYRVVGGRITEITGEEEVITVDDALGQSPLSVQKHLRQALDLFADREAPDYRNSIKESISAVEAICIQITGNHKATLGAALDEIERRKTVNLHNALKDSFKKLYGYTSDADGIRHAMLDEPNLSAEDAKFMLVSCSAFINYLMVKADKAGIKL